jgi:hypothetical protein
MSTNVPKWSDWLNMSDDERIKCQDTWDTYKNDGQHIVEKVLSKFQEEYGNIPQLEILGKGICHGGTWVISIRYPSVFDSEKVPKSFLGINVRAMISEMSE